MLTAGHYHTLTVRRISDHGLYLGNEEGDEVLLPNRFVSLSDRIGDRKEVFVYHDSEDRLVATTERPLATVGQAAFLEAVDKTVHGITSLVVIGGDGSLTGARIFAEEYNFPIVGLPGTIDNDLYGTDTTIGYDTALNTIMQSVDKIRDTATSHERLFFIEVMGREAGFLALNGAIASGAEAAIIPEIAMEVDQLDQLIENGFRKSKNSSIVLVAESELTGGAMGLAERVKNEYPQYDVRVTILGHIQRGGSPTASDRIMASRMGEAAINALLEDQRNVMIGIQNDELVYIPFSRAIKCQKPINRQLLTTLRVLSI